MRPLRSQTASLPDRFAPRPALPVSFLFFVLCLFFLGFVSGVDVDDSIYERFDEGDEEVRVLIKVNNDSEESGIFGVFGFGGKDVGDVVGDDGINKKVGDYVSANIDRGDLEELEAGGFVESIGIERVYHTMLQDSVGIINASSVWGLEVGGLNLTGTGQTVCIIDSGINYSHADFGGCSSSEFMAGNCSKVIGGWDFCGNDGNCSEEDGDPMDVYGHGTHVAGIVAASGGISGVGTGAKIVMMKASDSAGSFFEGDIISAIDRCVANASVFNISVISMSLGGGQYTGYCDDVDVAVTNSINNAVANGISVVVATGNVIEGYLDATAGIASPACIESVTRVTASDKDDLYAGYAFRHANFPDILVAPGSSVNSTIIGGGYGLSSGTSMAAPMVSGVIAIINQYLELSGQSKTTGEIESVLNSTGVVLDDSGRSGYDFSRVDVYSAVLSLDVDAPDVSLVTPVDGYVDMGVNQTFVCNATDWQLANLSLSVWNSSGLYYNSSDVFNVSNFSEGVYSWNCLGVDALGNSGYASANFSLTIGGISTSLLLPATESYGSLNDVNFSCRVVSDVSHEISNVTFYLWNESELIYNLSEGVSGFDNTTVFNYSFVDPVRYGSNGASGNYSWNCLGVNNGSNESWGDSNFSFIFDSVVPVISSLGETVSSSGATISWTTDEVANSSVSLGGGSWSNSSSYVTDHSVVVSDLSASTTYDYNVSSCDRAGNCVNGSGGFVTGAVSSSSSSGSSSSGGSSSVGGSFVRVVETEINEEVVNESEELAEVVVPSSDITGNVVGDGEIEGDYLWIVVVLVVVWVGIVFIIFRAYRKKLKGSKSKKKNGKGKKTKA